MTPTQASSPPRIKAILFDLDDTLWPLETVIKNAEATLYNWLEEQVPVLTQHYTREQLRALRTALIPSDPRFAYDLWALRHATLIHACHQCGADASRMDAAMAIFSAARSAVTPFDDVASGLETLNRHYVIGSISNGFADLHAIGLAHHFKASLAAHEFGVAKPDPTIFLAACEAIEVKPEEALYIGDDPYLDVEGAQKAGLHGAWMNRFDRTFPEHIRPCARFRTLDDLIFWLGSGNTSRGFSS